MEDTAETKDFNIRKKHLDNRYTHTEMMVDSCVSGLFIILINNRTEYIILLLSTYKNDSIILFNDD